MFIKEDSSTECFTQVQTRLEQLQLAIQSLNVNLFIIK